uniref:Bm350 n=1 Tax=Brugia malayi TaxID=6279 RepID=A0A1I9G143_BRUMA|nr:Bm350 [Brugia malayi]
MHLHSDLHGRTHTSHTSLDDLSSRKLIENKNQWERRRGRCGDGEGEEEKRSGEVGWFSVCFLILESIKDSRKNRTAAERSFEIQDFVGNIL